MIKPNPADPELDPDGLDVIGDEFGAEVQAEIEFAWTVILRGFNSNFFDLEPAEAELAIQVFANPHRYLSTDEILDMELFACAIREEMATTPIATSRR